MTCEKNNRNKIVIIGNKQRVLASHSYFCSFFTSHLSIIICKIFFAGSYSFFSPICTHEQLEDRSMIVNACDECTRALYFSLTSFLLGTI